MKPSSVAIDIQYVTEHPAPPREQFEQWINSALLIIDETVSELTVRIVDRDEMTELNTQFRKKTGATNVLSFPYPSSLPGDNGLMGDIAICQPVVVAEAEEQGKLVQAHWAHLTLHGLLHIVGYDHQTDEEAEAMESKEIKIMAQLSFDNPYQENPK